MTSNLKNSAIEKICVVLEASKIHLLKSNDYFELIFDTWWSKVFTPHLTDFVYGSLTKLDEPTVIDIIAGLLVATQKGRVWYKFINNSGGFSILEFERYLLPYIKVRLFSPQVFI